MRLAGHLTLLSLAMVCLGCGDYKVTFQVQDAINTGPGGGPLDSELLDVDVVCLRPADTAKHPELVNGAMRSKAWFEARERKPGAAPITDIRGKQIYALRGEGPLYANYTDDTRAGGPLTPGSAGGKREVTISVKHPQFLSDDAALVIFGRFQDGRGGLAETDPVVIKPPPAWNTTVIIDVGPMRLDWKNRP